MKYYNQDKEEILKKLKTSINGLSSDKANELLIINGKNELPKPKKDSVFKLFINQFKNPIELILVVTVFLSFIANEVVDAIALIVIIMVDVLMGTYQEWKARKDAESLINMIRVMSHVIRDGKEIEIDANQIVVGDIITLESGTKISADARILECHNFQVDECMHLLCIILRQRGRAEPCLMLLVQRNHTHSFQVACNVSASFQLC